MDFNGSLWVLTRFQGFLWVFMGAYRCLIVLMDSNGFLCVLSCP